MSRAAERARCSVEEYRIAPNSHRDSRLPAPRAGLEATSQLALAVGAVAAANSQVIYDVSELASIVGRGGTSGVGVHEFAHGGFVAGCGYRVKEKAGTGTYPPLLAISSGISSGISAADGIAAPVP